MIKPTNWKQWSKIIILSPKKIKLNRYYKLKYTYVWEILPMCCRHLTFLLFMITATATHMTPKTTIVGTIMVILLYVSFAIVSSVELL